MLRELKSQSSNISRLVTVTSSVSSSLLKDLEVVRRSPAGQPADLVHAISQQIQNLSMNKCNPQQESALRLLQSLPLNQNSLSMTLQQKGSPEPFQDSRMPYKPYSKPKSIESSHETSTHGVRSNTRETPQNSFQSWAKIRGPRAQWASESVTENWDLAIHKFPLGRMTVRKTSQRMRKKACRKQDHRSSLALTFTLYPAPWIANKIIELSLRRESSSISCGLETCSYNQDPMLAKCLRNGDIPGLKILFASGKAKPTDILAPWGNSFLHVSQLAFAFEDPRIANDQCMQETIYNCLSTNANSVQVSNFLIEQGADPDARNLHGRSVVTGYDTHLKATEILAVPRCIYVASS